MATALLLIAIWAFKLVVQVRGFRDPFVPLSEDVNFLLRETFWGTVWVAQGLVLPALAAAFWWARGTGSGDDDPRATGRAGAADDFRASPGWWLAGTLSLALVATLALSSHAMGVESRRAVIVAVDGAHALAAGAWIGSLVVVLLAGRDPERAGGTDSFFTAQIRVFSPMAMVAVGALVGMGVILSWTHLTALSDLWTTGYGRVLLAKVTLAAVVLALGFLNWRRGLPRSETSEGELVLRRRASWEVAAALGVLLLTAVLTHSAKP
jgi:putative copper export protein